jgi:hypothetical protein
MTGAGPAGSLEPGARDERPPANGLPGPESGERD